MHKQPLLLTDTVNCRQLRGLFKHQILTVGECSCQKNLIRFLVSFPATVLLHTASFVYLIQLSTALYFMSSSNIWIPCVSAMFLAQIPSTLYQHIFKRLNKPNTLLQGRLCNPVTKQNIRDKKIEKKGKNHTHLQDENETEPSCCYSLPSPTHIQQSGIASSTSPI